MITQQDITPQPRVIGDRYALEVELGRGGMGVVWRAQDQMIGRKVAIKELHVPETGSAEDRGVLEDRILREARTAGRLNDPGVVTVFDIVSEATARFIVMELVEAPTLAALVSQHGPMSPAQVAAIAEQALAALECAHAAGVVHRDVKPSNIMVRSDGRVKLTDFGVAQAVDDPKLTVAGGVIGSPAYLSPERLHGNEATPASDLWALGVTLYHALEGLNPFERTSIASTLRAVMHETPRVTRTSGVLAAIINGLLVADPHLRLSGSQALTLLQYARQTPAQGVASVPPVSVVPPIAPVALAPIGPPAHRQMSSRPLTPRWLVPVLAPILVILIFLGGALANEVLFNSADEPDALAPTLNTSMLGELSKPVLGQKNCGMNFLSEGILVQRVPCSDIHDVELFAAADPFAVAEVVPYPGEDWLSDYAEKYCTLHFASDQVMFTGKWTALRFAAAVPNQQEWRTKKSSAVGSRQVLCVLWKADQSILTNR